jgi:hypothetical protein
LVAESRGNCNLRQRLPTVPQQKTDKFQPSRCNVLEWRYSDTDFEGSEQLSDADANQTCKILPRDPLGQMLLDVVDDPVQLPASQAAPRPRFAAVLRFVSRARLQDRACSHQISP